MQVKEVWRFGIGNPTHEYWISDPELGFRHRILTEPSQLYKSRMHTITLNYNLLMGLTCRISTDRHFTHLDYRCRRSRIYLKPHSNSSF